MCIHSTSNYKEPSASGGPVLPDHSFCSQCPSSGFLLAVWECVGEEITACLNTGGRKEEESRESGTGWCVKQALLFLQLSLQPNTTPISSSRKLSGCNLPLAMH